VITDPIRICELLVGLPDGNVLGVADDAVLRVHVELRDPSRWCPDCGQRGMWKERRRVELVDLAAFGRGPAVVAQAPVEVCQRRTDRCAHRLNLPSLIEVAVFLTQFMGRPRAVVSVVVDSFLSWVLHPGRATSTDGDAMAVVLAVGCHIPDSLMEPHVL